MGCFSFMCKECGKPILSNSLAGQKTKLFLLKDGEVIQMMEGEYDSYGRVFIDGTQDETVRHELRMSIDWENPFPEMPVKNGRNTWGRVCDLMWSDDESNGIAAIHSKCFTGVMPCTRSKQDPNQGWGEDGEYFGSADPSEVIE